MNCKHCGKPIGKHEAGRETDICTGLALGGQYKLVYYGDYPTPFTDRMAWAGSCISHLAADDNPVDSIMMFYALGEWSVEIHMKTKPGVKEWDSHTVTADTLPLALCRAVLTLEAVEASDE